MSNAHPDDLLAWPILRDGTQKCELVALASHAHGTNKRELVEKLSRIGVSGAAIDDEEMCYLLDQVISPHAKGLEQAQFSTDYVVPMLCNRV